MVNAVAGQTALALLTATSTADQTSTRKNPLLPSPLSLSQQGSRQRVSPILQFDTPRISGSAFSVLQDTAQLSVTRDVASGDEKTRLERELSRSITVTETPGTPGNPGTPDTVTSTTTASTGLSTDALGALRQLIDGFTTAGNGHHYGHGNSHGYPYGHGHDGHHSGNHGNSYAGRITGILNAALADLQNGSLDAAAVQRLQGAITEVGGLRNIPGRRDDRLRGQAIGGLQDILDR